MDTINDQENIKRIQQVDSRTRMIHKGREDEWKQIRSDMKAGSGATKVNVSTVFSGDGELPTVASILHTLEKELQSQGDTVAEYEKQDWDDPAEYISQGWCEALEFAIKTIKRHNKS
jgi:hypothetical protein